MNASDKQTCRQCGADIPPAATERLCPACLLSGALETADGLTRTVTTVPGGPLSQHGPAQFPFDFGQYRLRGLLGRGGMGVVYDAETRDTGRRVALKVLGLQLDSPEMRQRFLREGRLAARVNHPNSLYVFGSEEIDGLPVITMEIAGAGTLKDRLKEHGPLPIAEAVDAILDVIAGLESAEDAGVLHRDIKPSNCFVCPDGSVKVGDFGLSVSTLAKTDTLVTAHGRIMGTPAFASPEQLRGDELDVRADIYSVGATLFMLLTNRAPFEGDNAVQVVANAVNQPPTPLRELREDVPPALAQIVTRCLTKEPDGRFASYAALRNALLPFGSKEPQPASILARMAAGWIDYLLAFLPPYVALMLIVGGEELLVRPVVEHTLLSARYYLLLFALGFAYFAIAEGIWGAGLGKWLKGLRVVRPNGRAPGVGRALLRIVVPILCAEGVRMPLMMAMISDYQWTSFQTIVFVLAAVFCGWIPGALAIVARRENGYATVWDLVSGTRVVIKPKSTKRPAIAPVTEPKLPGDEANAPRFGPYQITGEPIADDWLAGTDPVLRRRVWLLRRQSAELPLARREVARPGRLRWLQTVTAGEETWDAYEAIQGKPLLTLVERDKQVPWATLRYWLHDIAEELWAAAADQTLPTTLSLAQVWITADGRALLLDRPWPAIDARAEPMPVSDMAGQQCFLHAVASFVEPTGAPLHARSVLKNLAQEKFEKLSYLAGTLRGLLDRPADVSRGIRAGSIFMLPFYIWVAVFVGRYHDKPWDSAGSMILNSVLIVLAVMAVAQLLAVPLRNTICHTIFRLAVINAAGEPASPTRRLLRWAVAWLPLAVPMALTMWLGQSNTGTARVLAFVILIVWLLAAAYCVLHPHRGLHDRLAGTWVVRR